ncbi:hypothetical protein FPCIR_12935 [Fusarium pseudocircinatum]|uniref:Uncharacterized protein n=1 Tax=Fusarium pseudocircinatum TaxID=56676 RepID=A0A8H5KMJ9_9HYPO|nr:hypothetical protein FPCIR_12935 [Fusarium pseudocircinatum]
MPTFDGIVSEFPDIRIDFNTATSTFDGISGNSDTQTFNGIVSEFPDIRIDFFRRNAGAQPPLACFPSHVHSDRVAGIESLILTT